ncbi:lysophospholipid acyltransferase family protein [Yoonia sp.]|uniref:lysophospholipid acyltransferase family protein n=1 Tax=Yoonia sp. TaxID=2212373 RepID=UPI0035C806E4
MEHRIEPLIAERAPWLYSNHLSTDLARRILHRVLGYQKTITLADSFAKKNSAQIMQDLGKRLAQHVQVQGLGNLPAHGPALIVANHPTGIADGIILYHLIARQRPDVYFLANQDILRVLPQMQNMIAPVEWRHDKRSHSKTRATMAFIRKSTDQGRMGVIFPSGRLAKRRGLRLYERPWMASAAMLARKFDLPVVPVNIQARNSALFYLLDKLHPTLRDITLFHETLNKDRQPFRVTIGEPISASALPRGSEEGIALLRKATLSLAGDDAPTVNLVKSARSWVR